MQWAPLKNIMLSQSDAIISVIEMKNAQQKQYIAVVGVIGRCGLLKLYL